jgi:aminotransferase
VTPPEVERGSAALAIKHDLLVISDEIYAQPHLRQCPRAAGRALPGMASAPSRSTGFSKAYAMTGWRVGYFAARAAGAGAGRHPQRPRDLARPR